MMNQIGFVLITHSEPNQIVRLVRALNQVYSDPMIVIHHDFSQSPLDVSCFENVKVVCPHFRTEWCGYSVVEATMAGIALLYQRPGPDWFAVLSGSCYPTKSSKDVIADLEREGCDAYIDHQLIDPFHLENEYQRECFRRYYSLSFGLQKLNRRMTPPSIAALTAPYSSNGNRCYAGSEWFTANRAVGQYIVESREQYAWLARHLRNRHCPDETYFQTILCNARQFKMSNSAHRYIDWSARKPHPEQLDVEALPEILRVSAHFARKFSAGSPVLDRLDSMLGVRGQ